MDTVLLKSRGPVEFTRRTMIRHESGNQYLAPVTYRFTFENDFKNAVPKTIWEELREEYLDRKQGLRYSEFFLEL